MSDQNTDELVRKWDGAKQSVDNLKHMLNAAECDLRNATIALAKWLTPDDATENEEFSIWVAGRLISVYYDKTKGIAEVWERRKRKE